MMAKPDEQRPKAMVTGAASGIGLATARRLRREGYSVIGVDRDHRGLERLASEGIEQFHADLSSAAERDRVVDVSDGVECLVNAAGMIVLKPIFEVTLEDLERVYQVNVQAVWDLTSRIGAAMSSGGTIVNVSSSSAKLANTVEAAAYASTKAAVLSITRSFAYALAGNNVRVNAVCPGIIDTPMQDAVLSRMASHRNMSVEDLIAARNATVPLGRAATADECASSIWYLLSPESSYMTGQAINVTGGLVMH